MKFTPIVSEKDIKTLLLEEAEALRNGKKPRPIILSKRRFQEFDERFDVLEVPYDWNATFLDNDDLKYNVFEKASDVPKNGSSYGLVAFQHIGGLYIVKRLFGIDEYKYYDKYMFCSEEPDEIAYIE